MNCREAISFRLVLHYGFAAALLLGLAGTSYAQATAGTIRGVITDSSGAIIVAAEVRATNLGTDQAVSAQTTEAGVYVLGNVPVGNYRLEAESPGFRGFAREPINVATASTTAVDIRLELGQVTETVTVEAAAAALVQTDSAEVSTVMEKKMVMDLPLGLGSTSGGGSGRRQIEQFIFLTPGVTGNNWEKHFLGSPQQTSQAIIDGVPHGLQESPGLTVRTSPPFEAVEEFKISTTLYPADQGRGFGISNYTLKSGTNQFHGNAFWFVRNDQLDSSGFFSPRRPIVRQNEYGGTLGGPVVKNKTFFFTSYQGFILRSGAPGAALRTIPTTAFRQGDFGELRTPSGNLIPIFDPASTRADPAGGFARDPFDGNRIPSARISPVAAQVLGLLPQPDGPGIVDNWLDRSSSPVTDYSVSVKADHSHGDNHRFSMTWWKPRLDAKRYSTFGKGHSLDPSTSSILIVGGGTRGSWDWTVTPKMLNHFAYGYSFSNKDRTHNDRETHWNEQLGIPGIPTDRSGFPQFTISPYVSMGTANHVIRTEDRAHILTNTLSWTRGRHYFKFGGEYWNQRFMRARTRGETGEFHFNKFATSQPNSPSFSTWGDAAASMLLGQVFRGYRRVNPTDNIFYTTYSAVFFEDKIQLTPKLTMSLGLRYEIPTPIRVEDGAWSVIDLDLPNPAAGGIPGAHVFGDDGRPDTDYNEWSPRVSLAYRLNDKTVIRSGFGLIYAQSNALSAGIELGGNEFRAGFTDFSQPRSLDQGVTPAFVLDRGFPPFEGKLPNLVPGLNVGRTADYISPTSGRAAYTTNYNLTIQRELPFKMFADIAYVGNKGTRLPSNMENLNQVPSSYLSLGATLRANINSMQAHEAGITAPYPGFSGSVAQALRPYPQFTGLVTHANGIGNSTYHSMQARVQKRFSRGLSFLVSYTLSKSISDNQGNAWANAEIKALDSGNRALEKSISPFDQTHNLATSWVYELPLGKSATGGAAKVLKGWQVAGITQYRSGPPLRIFGGSALPIFGGGNRPDRVAGVDRRTGVSPGDFDPARHLYLNIDAFAQPAPYTFGNVSRVEPDLHGFSFWTENFTLSKRTFVPSISENFNVEFRAEFFNLFNRVVFGSPASNVNSRQGFGRVRGQANGPRAIQFGLKFNF